MSRRRLRAALQRLGERCDVKLWIPPENLVVAADERTGGMVDYYRSVSITRTMTVEDLQCLARSAYLQGCTDMANVAAGMTPPGDQL